MYSLPGSCNVHFGAATFEVRVVTAGAEATQCIVPDVQDVKL